MKVITAENVKNKRVLIRLDLDIPCNDKGEIVDSTRIDAAAQTIALLVHNARQIIFCGHRGRPKGQFDSELSLKPLIPYLRQYVDMPITLFDYDSFMSGNEDRYMKNEFILLENLRFFPGEAENDPIFAKKLADLADIFIFEAFGVAHRQEAATVGVTKLLPSFAGLHVAKEVIELSNIIHDPIKPFVIVLGGSKIETKLPVIYHLEDHAEAILVGGLLAKEVKDQKLEMPANCVIADIREDGLDITEESMTRFTNILSKAQTIVWNGPMGKFEDEEAIQGSQEVASAMVNSGAYTVVGGGDTLAALHGFELLDQIDFVSVGGGAMLEFLSGKELPAIKALS